jgi:hypothetical protein
VDESTSRIIIYTSISFGNKVIREYFSLFRFCRKLPLRVCSNPGNPSFDVVSKIGVGVVRMDSTNVSQDLVFGVLMNFPVADDGGNSNGSFF